MSTDVEEGGLEGMGAGRGGKECSAQFPSKRPRRWRCTGHGRRANRGGKLLLKSELLTPVFRALEADLINKTGLSAHATGGSRPRTRPLRGRFGITIRGCIRRWSTSARCSLRKTGLPLRPIKPLDDLAYGIRNPGARPDHQPHAYLQPITHNPLHRQRLP